MPNPFDITVTHHYMCICGKQGKITEVSTSSVGDNRYTVETTIKIDHPDEMSKDCVELIEEYKRDLQRILPDFTSSSTVARLKGFQTVAIFSYYMKG